MSYKKFLATATVSAVAVTTAVSSASASYFPDVSDSSVYSKPIESLVDSGVITGYPDGTFQPNKTLIREHAAIMFVRALKLDVPVDAVERLEVYSDVNAQTKNADKVAALLGAGIVKGDEGTFSPNQDLTREIMATWLVRAFDLKEISSVKVPLTDLKTASNEHRKNIEILYQNGITTGNTDGTYAPKKGVTRAQFATFFYRAFNQAESGVSNVERLDDLVVGIGGKVNLSKKVEVTYKDGKKKEVNVKWDNTSIDTSKEGKYEITGTVDGIVEKAYLTVYVEEVDLKIEDVEALNLKQIELTFNHTRFEGGHPENLSYYTLRESDDDEIELLDATLEDNKLILTLKEATQGKFELVVDKAITGDEEDFDIRLKDTTPPEVISAKAIAEDIVQVEFSEAMDFKTENGEEVTNRDIEDSIELEKGPRVKEMTVYEHGKVVNIKFSDELVDKKEYKLELTDDLRDYFGFKLEEKKFEFDVKYDKNDPELVEVKNVYPNKVTLVFDKDIKLADSRHVEGYFHHTNGGIDADKVTLQNRNEVVITFEEDEPIPAKGELIIDSRAIEDLWGNENKTIRKDIDLKDDKTAPTIKSVKMLDEDDANSSYVQFEVTFDEPVKQELAEDKRLYELVDKDGEDIYVKGVDVIDSTEGFTVLLTIDKRYGEFNNGTYTIVIDDMEDLYENESKQLSIEVKAGSVEAPSEFKGSLIWDKDEEEIILVIDYGREMETKGEYSVSSLDKYELTVDDQTYLLSSLEDEDELEVDLNTYNDGEKVEIVFSKDDDLEGAIETFFEDLKDAAEDKDLDDVELLIGRVSDAEGNKTTSFLNEVTLDSTSTFGVKDDKVTLVDDDTLEFELTDVVYDFDDDDFIVFADDNRNGKYSKSESLDIDDIELDDDDKTVIIKLDEPLDSDGSYGNDKVYITTESTTHTRNRFGQKLKFSNLEVSDSVGPTVKEKDDDEQVFVHEAIGESDKAVISIEFTDDIDPKTVTRLSFDVGDGRFDILSAYVDDETVYLVVDLDRYEVEDLVGEYIEQKAPIADTNDNVVEDLDLKVIDEEDKLDIDDLD
ncbi:S-layer homology domain-containing protein [Bacillus solimangrovi]|uniref:SLH domain-containing protein n=1 Tax=Bacillus solimangrovi TaxID=1305675 RepID=A0A1E5LGZ2_9BACI|nr:S-layer homology domain-containing protein [Bacillus solimangrovi]OEH93345.1 hypothetical protein BFG57_12545 [Bacillus solimangrovi]